MQDHRPQPESPQPPQERGGLLKGGVAATLVAVLAKGKGLLFALKAVPLGKVFLTGGSMMVSVLMYAINGGFLFALCFVLMILIHELGHGYAMKRAGISASWPVFIPFFGAMISMKDTPSHPRIEAEVAYGGPLAGAGAALCAAALGLALHSRFFMSLAYLGFFLNLFNLVPIGFLDGGRIARLLSRKAAGIGAVILGAMLIFSPTPQLLLITVMSVMHAFKRDNADLEMVTADDRRTWAIRYFGLCAFLGAGALLSHKILERTGV